MNSVLQKSNPMNWVEFRVQPFSKDLIGAATNLIRCAMGIKLSSSVRILDLP
jgi:hypothetical protein